MRLRFGIVAMLATIGWPTIGSARPDDPRHAQWVPAWGAAQLRADGKDADAIGAAGPATVRQIVHLSAGGRFVRIRLSNVAGDQPLRIAAASLARSVGPGSDEIGDLRPLTFAGVQAVTIPPGAALYSDPVPIDVATGKDLAISLFFPERVTHRTGHPGARATAFLASGDQTTRMALAGAQRIGGWWSLSDVEVADGPQDTAVVAIGDSITDGHGIPDDSNLRWPDLLARRLAADPDSRHLSIVNAGIGGNRVLLDGIGPNLLARFDRDVLGRAQVRYAIVLEGVNDLGVLTRDHPATAAEHSAIVAAITGAYRDLADRAHAHGIRLIGGTITPFGGNDYYHPGPDSEADRLAINDFIRSSGTFDDVVDFDGAVRDPAHPDRLSGGADTGDHLHPNAAGYEKMANAVDLAIFKVSLPSEPIVVNPGTPDVTRKPARPKIALTFDDLPAHGPLPSGGDRLDVARTIIAALAAHHAPAFGFMNAGFGAGDPEAPRVLAAWHQAGLPIGNHGFHHLNLDQVGATVFLADARANEPALSAAADGGDWHWFRYPFLAEGRDAAATAAVRDGLYRDGGYRIAAVTMSFGDYAWNDAYARCAARHDDAAIRELEQSYLAAAKAQARRSRTLARSALGHDIPYVLLMHLGAFDARMLPRLLTLYEQLGFGFTTLPDAQADPFYAAAMNLSLPGPSPTLEAAAAKAGVAVPANAALPDPRRCR